MMNEMMNEMNVIFDEDAKKYLIDGVNLISKAVATTFGPNGQNVIIKGASGLHITKDGATVARYVESQNPYINMGVELVKNIATKTAKDVGDGTTTATILASSIIELLKDNVDHPIVISRALEKDIQTVVKYLEKNKKLITTEEDLIKVATISTNNDEFLGQLIGETYFQVTKDGVVTVEESSDTKTTVVYSKGMKLPSGYISPYFVNNEKNECVLENVLIHVSETSINDIKDIKDVCELAIKEYKTLLIIAPKVDSNVLRTLLMNNDDGNLRSCCISSPGHGVFRDMLLKDLKNKVGNTCDKVTISKDSIVLVGGEPQQMEIALETVNIRKILKNTNLSDFEKKFYKERLANYSGDIATILVGGFSKVEISEKKDRVEDAICSVKAAYEGGVLPGGGVALAKASEELDLIYLKDVLKKPISILRESSNIQDLKINTDFWKERSLSDNKLIDMYEEGIIDPFLVTKIALENAGSAASLVLTSGCSIINM